MPWRWPWATEEWWWRLRNNARKIWKSGEPWCTCNWMSFTQLFLLGPVFFRTALRCNGGYHLERGGMPLHDAVRINCKKMCNYWKSRHRSQVYGLSGVCWMILFVLSDLTWLPLLGGVRKSWYTIIYYNWNKNMNIFELEQSVQTESTVNKNAS